MSISSDVISTGCNCSGIGAIVQPASIYIKDITWDLESDENHPNEYNCDQITGGTGEIKYELKCYRLYSATGLSTTIVTTLVLVIIFSLIIIGMLAMKVVKLRKSIENLKNYNRIIKNKSNNQENENIELLNRIKKLNNRSLNFSITNSHNGIE